jgi:hypothetical protein
LAKPLDPQQVVDVAGDSDQVVALPEIGIISNQAVHRLIPDIHVDIIWGQGRNRR